MRLWSIWHGLSLCTSSVDFGVFATECDTHQDYTPPKTGVVVELCPDWLTQLVQVSYWSVHFQAATNFWLFWFGFVWWHPIVIGSHKSSLGLLACSSSWKSLTGLVRSGWMCKLMIRFNGLVDHGSFWVFLILLRIAVKALSAVEWLLGPNVLLCNQLSLDNCLYIV